MTPNGSDAATGMDATSTAMDATSTAMDATSTAMDATTAMDAAATDAGLADAGMVDTTCNPSFGSADGCGGDVQGRWTYRASCTDQNVFAGVQQLCAGATFSDQVVVASGTLDITAGGNITRDANTTVTANIAVPAACAALAGGCAGVEAAIEGTSSAITASCTGAASCDCAVTKHVVTHDTGTYSTNGALLTAIVNANSYQYDYCAANGALRYRGRAGNPDDDTLVYVLSH